MSNTNNIPVNQIEFAQDTEERRKWFRAASFSHPAKMVLGLQTYLIEHYTKVGETILDPMAGSGTVLVGCALGRNVICVELEAKFVKMIEANWEKIKSLGPMLGCKMGEATILQGDARQLDKLLVDKCIFSPPYADQPNPSRTNHGILNHKENCKCNFCRKNRGNKGEMQGYRQVDKIVTSPPYARDKGGEKGMLVNDPKRKNALGLYRTYSSSQSNIDNLPYGEISVVISSPPHRDSAVSAGNVGRQIEKRWGKGKALSGRRYADAVITSPPYEGMKKDDKRANDPEQIDKRARAFERAGGNFHTPGRLRTIARHYAGYNEDKENIGNLRSENYLEAMLQVYRQCHRVLRDGGLLCLVVKNFIRDKKIVRLDRDTIKLCEKAGFVLKEQLKRKLTQQSFWRIIYQKKFPDAPKIEFEDVLIFEKG